MNQEIRANITIIEDNEMYTFFLREKLKDKLSLNLIVYRSAEEYLEYIEEGNTSDIVILDYNLPGVNGFDALKRIKKVNPETEIIILSGNNDVQTAVDLLKAGAFDYIIKNKEAGDNVFLSISKALDHQYLRKENISLKLKLSKYKMFMILLVATVAALFILFATK
jgi:DNA-binding NtrC family response regulator